MLNLFCGWGLICYTKDCVEFLRAMLFNRLLILKEREVSEESDGLVLGLWAYGLGVEYIHC